MITILQGTARQEAQSAKVGSALLQALQTSSQSAQLVGVAGFLSSPATRRLSNHPDDEGLQRWQQVVVESTALVLVVPEYNHSLPGECKLLLDSLGRSDYEGKSVFLVTVSGGAFGGVRAADHCLPVLHTLGFNLQPAALHITKVKEQFDADGAISDDVLRDRVQTFVQAVQAL